MTQEEIIAMARAAGFSVGDRETLAGPLPIVRQRGFDCKPELARFAALVAANAAAAEREACAQVCEMHIDKHEAEKAKKRVESAQKCCDEASELKALRHELVVSTFNAGIKTCAKSIRARGGNV